MTIKQCLMDRVNDWIARQLWAKISTELDTGMGELNDEHAKFPWIVKRAKELLKEYSVEQETKN